MSTLTITRIAYSSVLIDFDGHRVLTDPWLSERDGYYHGEPYGITLETLPRLDGVAVSHDHYDHYDMEAFQAYPDKQVPITVTAAPGKHSVPEITYLLQTGGLTVYFGGDTLLIPELSEIPRRFPQVDVALPS